jgi:hypothetical protein
MWLNLATWSMENFHFSEGSAWVFEVISLTYEPRRILSCTERSQKHLPKLNGLLIFLF